MWNALFILKLPSKVQHKHKKLTFTLLMWLMCSAKQCNGLMELCSQVQPPIRWFWGLTERDRTTEAQVIPATQMTTRESLFVEVTWEVCEGIFAAVGLGDSASELLENVVELGRALQRPVLCHTKALFQGMELPLVCYQLLCEEERKKEGKKGTLVRDNVHPFWLSERRETSWTS